MHYVIGTGPSGISAAYALAKRDLPVCIVDSATSLEAEGQALKARLSAGEPGDWSAKDLDALREATTPTETGVKEKLVFGSSFAYRDVPGAPPLRVENARVSRSFARGGLSNVWGACTLPYPEAEVADWPVELDDMRRHYREVMEFLPQSGAKDGLTDVFPWPDETGQALSLSAQSAGLLSDLRRSAEPLKRLGVRFGEARLAIDANGALNHSDCRHCGLCLYGCPYDVIYTSSQTLARLLEKPNVSYVPGVWVERLEERHGNVRIHGERIDDRAPVRFDAEKVFVGAGVIETARILLRSLEAYETPVRLLHSDKFVVPFVRFRGTRGISEARLHTSCQLFLEVLDSDLCDYMIHLQVYGYNDLYPRALEKTLGRFAKLAGKRVVRAAVERLFVLFGYLHSNVSSEMQLQLGRGRSGELRVTGKPNPRAGEIAGKLTGRLRRQAWRLRGVLGRPAMDPPGGGNHSGGTFPMRGSPVELETNALGVPTGFDNVHIVDASVLPTLSATTITLAVMANAHRIASQTD